METIGNFFYEYRFILTIIFIIISLPYTIYEAWNAPLINCEEDDLPYHAELEKQIEKDVDKYLSTPPSAEVLEFKEQLNKIHNEFKDKKNMKNTIVNHTESFKRMRQEEIDFINGCTWCGQPKTTWKWVCNSCYDLFTKKSV